MSQRECKCKDCETARSLLVAHRDKLLKDRAELYKQYERLLRQLHFSEKTGDVEIAP